MSATSSATPLVSSSSPRFSKKPSPKSLITKPAIFIFTILSLVLLFSYRLHSFLKGLGGFKSTPLTAGGPISVIDFTTCVPAMEDYSSTPVECCPPVSTNIIDFTLPPPPKTIRIRRAAHLIDDEYVAKFSRAIQLMKELPDEDPRSFNQQAKIHCAYCNGGYHFLKSPETHYDIHQTWLFFPFHRFYLYFFEKILGKLINDPDFALPYWNWDSPDGMRMPEFFTDPNSSLYDSLRESKHQPPAIIDIDFNGTESMRNEQQQMYANLVLMYRQVVSGGRTPELFFGGSYHPGDPPRPSPATTEIVHNSIHFWVGDLSQPKGENMGAFYSAARDPIFYSHHSNIDRIWTIWKAIEGGNRTDLTDTDWLNSEFVFYDEEARFVKVKVKDCLDTTRLGYLYEDVAIPWLNTPPIPRISSLSRNAKNKKTVKTVNPAFPIKLDKVIRVLVKRSTKLWSRTKDEKPGEEEVLVVEGIEIDGEMFVKFDVIVNDGGDETGIVPENTEFAGSFVNLASLYGKKIKTTLRLGISELLRDLEVVDDDNVLVTLVPRYDSSAVSVTIGNIKIELQ